MRQSSSLVISLFLGHLTLAEAIKLDKHRSLPPYDDPYYNDHWRFCGRDDERYCGNAAWNDDQPRGYEVPHNHNFGLS